MKSIGGDGVGQVKVSLELYDQTDQQLTHNKLDTIVFEKDLRTCLIIDVACPCDMRVAIKQLEKVDRYSELKQEMNETSLVMSRCPDSANHNWSHEYNAKVLIKQRNALGLIASSDLLKQGLNHLKLPES